MENKSRIQELIDDVNAVRKCGKFLWKKRCIYIKYVCVGVVLSLIISFSIPKTYSSSVLLAPESIDETGSSLAGLASLAGANIGLMQDAYTVDLYPTIVSSVDFRISLGDLKVKSNELGIETTYFEYLLNNVKYPWWKYPLIWMRSWIAKLTNNKKSVGPKSENNIEGPRCLTKREMAFCGKVRANVNLSVESSSGVISVTVSDFDPEIAAIVVDSVASRLSTLIQNYRTSKVRKQYEYAVVLCDSTHESYMKTLDAYVKYASSHNSIYSPVQKAEFDLLEKELDLAYQSYSTAVSQKQMYQAKLLESTPVYTIVDSPYVPLSPDSPNKILMLIVFVFLSCVIATFRIAYSEIIKNNEQ